MWNFSYMYKRLVFVSIKNSTIQTVTYISRKVVYFKKHLIYQVQDPHETTFPQPLNVSYCCQKIKLAVGAMTEPLRT